MPAEIMSSKNPSKTVATLEDRFNYKSKVNHGGTAKNRLNDMLHIPFRRIAISLLCRTTPVTGSVKMFVSMLPSKYKIELQREQNKIATQFNNNHI